MIQTLSQTMSYNPEPTKQAREVIFICKTQDKNYPPLIFNKNSVE